MAAKLLLCDLPKEQPIRRVVVQSLDLALFQMFVVDNDEERLVWETKTQPLRRRSLMAMRELLATLDVAEIRLRHESAYDEMIGQAPKSAGNTLDVAVSTVFYPSPLTKR